MVKVADIYGKKDVEFFSVGSHFCSGLGDMDCEYVLCMPDIYHYSLINVKTGCRWADPFRMRTCSMPSKISIEEVVEIIGTNRIDEFYISPSLVPLKGLAERSKTPRGVKAAMRFISPHNGSEYIISIIPGYPTKAMLTNLGTGYAFSNPVDVLDVNNLSQAEATKLFCSLDWEVVVK